LWFPPISLALQLQINKVEMLQMIQVIIQPCCEGLVLKYQPGTGWYRHTCKEVEEGQEAAGTHRNFARMLQDHLHQRK